jgi:hypothetical protein
MSAVSYPVSMDDKEVSFPLESKDAKLFERTSFAVTKGFFECNKFKNLEISFSLDKTRFLMEHTLTRN